METIVYQCLLPFSAVFTALILFVRYQANKNYEKACACAKNIKPAPVPVEVEEEAMIP